MSTIAEYRDDFALWCRECVTIADKLTGAPVPFILNAPQRRLLKVMEGQRCARRPVRVILLKARQWGGSTLVQMYMAWMQLVRHTGWNSVICSHVKDASANIKGMYSALLRSYPGHLKGDNPKEWAFAPFEGSRNICCVPARDCRVALASAQAPDAARGLAFQMAHLSEVAFWGEGVADNASRIVRTVAGSVPLMPETLVVMESTADGPDGYFHDEWERAVAGRSDKAAVFVPWHEIGIYRKELDEAGRRALLPALDDYELGLLRTPGVTLEAVAWYHDKRREYATPEQMMAEYPSTPSEAFNASPSPRLDPADFL